MSRHDIESTGSGDERDLTVDSRSLLVFDLRDEPEDAGDQTLEDVGDQKLEGASDRKAVNAVESSAALRGGRR